MSAETDLQSAANAARNFSDAANEAADNTKKAGDKLKQTQDNLSNELRSQVKALGALGGSLARGTSDLQSFNGQLEILSLGLSLAATRLQRWGLGLSGVGGRLGRFGQALGVGGRTLEVFNKATLASAKYLTERLNASYKVFQQFGSVGALGAQGIEGLIDQSLQSKLGLEAFGKVVMDNSQTLAAFGGTAFQGAERFSQLISDLTDPAKTAGDELRNLGLRGEDIAQWAATYIASEQRMGRARATTAEQLTAGTIAYVKQLDELSRLTGESKENLEKQRQAAETDQQYRATLYKLEMQGRKPDADRLRDTISAIGKVYGPEMQQAAMAAASGMITNEKAAAASASTMGQFTGIITDVINNGQGMTSTLQRLQGAIEPSMGTIADFAQATHNASGTFINFAELAQGQAHALNQLTPDAIRREQDSAAKTQNKLTLQTQDAIKVMQETTIELTKLTKQALPAASTGVSLLATASLGAAKAMNAVFNAVFGGAGSAGAANAPGPNTTPGGAATGMVPGGGQLQPRPRLGPDALQQLNVRSQGERGQYDPRLIGLARNLQDMYPGITFTGINDRDNGAHGRGEALDFTLPGMTVGDVEQGRSMVESLRNMGFGFALDEYNNPSPRATGPHFHAQLATGGIVSGPKGGYNAMLHGTEAVVPLPDGRSIPVQNADSGNFELQLDRLDTIISVMRDQVQATQKLLAYAT